MTVSKVFSKTISMLLLTSAILTGSAIAGDAESRWNDIPELRQDRLTALAERLGHDLSTEEGRQAFKEALQERRIAAAAELGFDITTEEGREAFREARQEQRVSRAAELGFDITTEEGREAFRAARQEQRQDFHSYIAELSEEERAALREELRGMTREQRRDYIKELING